MKPNQRKIQLHWLLRAVAGAPHIRSQTSGRIPTFAVMVTIDDKVAKTIIIAKLNDKFKLYNAKSTRNSDAAGELLGAL